MEDTRKLAGAEPESTSLGERAHSASRGAATRGHRGQERHPSDGGAPPPSSAAPAVAHGPAEHDHGLAHTTPIRLLFGILAILLVLTVLTVTVTKVDLGSQGNLVVAMVIATVKAGLVVTYFMHLRWDRMFHLILFLVSILFAILFLGMAVTDRAEYQPTMDDFSARQPRQ